MIEKIICEIEKKKRMSYECFGLDERFYDPSFFTQMTQRLLGEQHAYDSVIFMLRTMIGSDDE